MIQTNIIGFQDDGIEVDLQGDVGGTPTYDGALWASGEYKVPVIHYTPEAIFANKVPILNANFLRPASSNPDTANPEDNMVALRNVVAGWYVAIRMISIIGLLSVLVYLSIRMMLSGVAADKAKYKKMLMSWVIAMCLLFFLHYLMSFIMTLSETITGLVSSAGDASINVNVGNGETKFATNLMGLVRFQVQHTDMMFKITYLVIYTIMIGYTLKFTWVYLKRMIIMAFLTLIAPLIALTYPIDKVGDGKAQGFDMWLKEYLYNALVQPLHCLIYVIFATSTIQLAKTNPLIALIIFPCMGYAEKFLKSLLGFNKASGGTQPSLATAVGAHALGTIVGNLARRGRGPGKGGGKPKTKEKVGGGLPIVGAPNDLDDSSNGYDPNELSFENTTIGRGARQTTGQLPPPPPPPPTGGQQQRQPREMDENESELVRQQQDILNDPNATDEEKAEAQKLLDYYQGNITDSDENVGELVRQQQDILNDPNATDEEKAEAQELLDYYQGVDDSEQDPQQQNQLPVSDDEEIARQRAEAQQQWLQGNTERTPIRTPYTPTEPRTIGEAIGQDLGRVGSYVGRRITGVARGVSRGAINTGRFVTNRDYARQTMVAAGRKIGSAGQAVKNGANNMALEGYKATKRNIRGAVAAAPTAAYTVGKAAVGTAVKLATAGTAAVVTGGIAYAATSVATGDPSKGLQAAATAAGGTYVGLSRLGEATIGNVVEDIEVKAGLSTDVKAAFQRGKYGSEAQAQNAREQKEWERSNEFNQFLRAKYQGKSKDEMEQARKAMIEYHKLGVKDNDDALKLYKAEAEVQKNIKAVGGKAPTRREMVSAMKAEAKADSRAWTNDEVFNKTKQSYVNRFSGTQAEKENKARRKMELARIIHDNK